MRGTLDVVVDTTEAVREPLAASLDSSVLFSVSGESVAASQGRPGVAVISRMPPEAAKGPVIRSGVMGRTAGSFSTGINTALSSTKSRMESGLPPEPTGMDGEEHPANMVNVQVKTITEAREHVRRRKSVMLAGISIVCPRSSMWDGR